MADLHEAAKNSQHKEPVCDDVCTHPDFACTFSCRKLILMLIIDYFPQSMLLSSLETLLCHPSSCKVKRVHNLLLCLQVRRWIKSPMVNVEKHPHASLKYPGSTVMNLPAGDSELEPPLCQTCLSDHPFQRGIAPQEAESCSWESQRNNKVSRSFLPTSFFFACFALKTGLYFQWACIYEMVYPWKRRDVPKPETLLTKMCCAHLGSAFYLKICYPWKTKDSSLQCCDVLSQYLNRLPVIINTIPLFYRNWGEDRWYYLSKIRKRTQTC